MTNNITTRLMLVVVLFPALALLLTAQPRDWEEKTLRELTSGSLLELNTFAELTTTPVESTRVFRVDIGGVLTLLEEAGIQEPVSVNIRVADMGQRVNPEPLAPDNPDFPTLARLVFFSGKAKEPGKALPQHCVLTVHNAAGEQLARFKALFYLFPVLDVEPFAPLMAAVEKEGYHLAYLWCKRRHRKLRMRCFDDLARITLYQGDYLAASRYWQRCESPQREAGFQVLGDVHFRNRRFQKALEFYEQAGISGNRARTCGILADREKEKGDNEAYLKWLKRAVMEYENVIKSPLFSWDDLNVKDYLERLTGWLERPKTEAEKATAARLERILDKCAAYCRRLYGSSFDFVCIEKERQKLPDSGVAQESYRLNQRSILDSDTLTTEYDYRLVRKNRKISEVRTRIRVNGRKVDEEVVEAPQDHPGVEKIIFGPLAMFESRWQPYFNFWFLGEETLGNEKAVVLDVIPMVRLEKNRIFGKVWVSEKDGSVLKIEFNPKSLINFEWVRKRVVEESGVPDMVVLAEYDVLRAGLRFPSHYFLEDAYINQKGKRVVRLQRDHEYRDYRFFAISSEVESVTWDDYR